MKQYLKYSIILVFAILSHHCVTRTIDHGEISESHPTQYCFQTQTPTSQQTILNMCAMFSMTSLCIEHANSQQTPSDKHSSGRICSGNGQSHILPRQCMLLSHLPHQDIPHPLTYYVFGLRKIII